jgi:OOP family OmpA-OmpF porin
MKRIALKSLMIVVAVALSTACASSRETLTFEPGSLDAEKYVRKVDQFVVITDGSLSMADRSRGHRKVGIAGDVLVSLNQTIPALEFEGALRTFGRGLCGSKGRTVSIIDLGKHIGATFDDGIARYQCANGRSPLHLALDASAVDMANHQAPSVVVVVSDGLHMGTKEIEAAAGLKDTFGDHFDIYAIQIGNDKNGRRLLQEVVRSGGDGAVVAARDLTTAHAMSEFVIDAFLWPDDDSDGVANHLDECPDTPRGVEVDAVGCPVDSDGDGVPDFLDRCPDTPAGVSVDGDGCPVDSDGDGVPDFRDQCPDTPRGVTVDAEGCPVDSDGDGVPDHLDACPNTPPGVPVTRNGCPIKGIEVAGDEWSVRGRVLFETNRATIRPEAAEVLLKVAAFLQKNPHFHVEIQGNTDSTGPMDWNMKLSEQRAGAVKDYLVTNGVAPHRLTTRGFGPHEPVAPNTTADGRAKNRRVDFKPSTR